MGVADAIFFAFGAYACVGVVVGILFVVKGVQRIDYSARGAGAPWHFRLIILPGAAALWPLVLKRWLRAWRVTVEIPP